MKVNRRAANTDEATPPPAAPGATRRWEFIFTTLTSCGRRRNCWKLPHCHRRAHRLVQAENFFPFMREWDGSLDTVLVTDLCFGKWEAALAERARRRAGNLPSLCGGRTGFCRGEHLFSPARQKPQRTLDVLGRNAFAADDFAATRHPDGAIGLSMLDGETARLNGHGDEVVANFRKARDLETALPYGEPPAWHQPVSHLLCAALIEPARWGPCGSGLSRTA